MSEVNLDTVRTATENYGDFSGTTVLSASTLNGDDVYDPLGEKLGSIKEIMLNIPTGTVCYAVLSFGGFLSMGEKLFAVPWAALKLDTENKRFVLNIEKARLENAPGFDTDDWPNMADQTWASGVHAYYGTSPSETVARV